MAAALLVNTACYGSLFWGMQYVPSGISAVVNLSLIPVGLFSIGLLAGEETFSRRKLAVIALGLTGLSLLFTPKIATSEELPQLLGMLALVAGTLAYCWGSILSRPLLRELDALRLSALHNLIGGAGLFGLSIAFEPLDAGTWKAFYSSPVLISWLFLALGGSVGAFTIYLSLLRDWGPSRAGLYAFVSPVVALAIGVLVYGEPFGHLELSGSAILLLAAGLAIKRRPVTDAGAETARAAAMAGARKTL